MSVQNKPINLVNRVMNIMFDCLIDNPINIMLVILCMNDIEIFPMEDKVAENKH